MKTQHQLIDAVRQYANEHVLYEGFNASSAAYAVGYESVPQFTRDYSRMFGAPLKRDFGNADKSRDLRAKEPSAA